MRPSRTVIVIAAVVAAVLTAVGANAFLSGSDARAYKGATLVKVYKVAKDIPKGYSGDDAIHAESVKADTIPQEYRPGTALTDINALRGKVALTNLSANQVLVDGMFVDPRVAQVTAAQRVPSGQVAVTVSMDQVHEVAGLLVPGDKVNIMVNVDGAEHTLFQNVSILYIGTTAAPQAGDTTAVTAPAAGGNLITFAVPQEAAQRIAFAAEQAGGLYLTLVPPDYKSGDIPAVNTGNLFNTTQTPYGP
ncbi:MAG TPA: Flp pilus assembly protein CpaB [Acidimicrobiales bacterium]|nr:Flp pilus assembly protein CpaB [Acidimicrobiales bacterium]